MNLDMLAFDFLHGSLLVDVMLPVLVELWEACPYIVNKKLWQFFVRFDHKAKKLAMIVIHYVAKLFLKREWLKVFPGEILGLEDEDPVL